MDIFEKGNKGDELFIVSGTFPFGKDDRIFGLVFGVGGDCIDQNNFGEITV